MLKYGQIQNNQAGQGCYNFSKIKQFNKMAAHNQNVKMEVWS